MKKVSIFSVEETCIPAPPRQGKDLSQPPSNDGKYYLVKLYDSAGRFIMAEHGNDLMTAKIKLYKGFADSRYSTNALQEYMDALKAYAESA